MVCFDGMGWDGLVVEREYRGVCCVFGGWVRMERGGCRLMLLGEELGLGWTEMLKRSASLCGGTGFTEAVRESVYKGSI